MKLYLYIRANHIESFLSGDVGFSLDVSEHNPERKAQYSDAIPCGFVDVEIDVDKKEIRQIAEQRLNDEIKRVRGLAQAEVERLETRKQNLLALEHDGVAA